MSVGIRSGCVTPLLASGHYLRKDGRKLADMIEDIHENVSRLKNPALYSGDGCRVSGTGGFVRLRSHLKWPNRRSPVELIVASFAASIFTDVARIRSCGQKLTRKEFHVAFP